MAIKITGTTVINDSRELENINNAADFVKSANFVLPPQLFIDGIPDDVATEPTLTTSEFSIFGGGSDTHASTDWEVIRTSDSTTVFSSIGDTTNLTSIDVTPALDNNEEYLFRVRHNGTSLGASEYREVSTKTFDPLENPEPGDAFCGGFYMGRICAAGTNYYIIVAPNATGCRCCQWKTTETCTSGAGSDTDGYANTYPALENSDHPAANFTATRTIGGFSDWYLPAIDELKMFYENGAGRGSGDPLPLGEDFDTTGYWSSREQSTINTCGLSFFNGDTFFTDKNRRRPIRAVRRVPF